MNIIRRRLAKALRLNEAKSQYMQRRNPERKRKAMSVRGTRLLTAHLSVMISPELLARLDELCGQFTVQRGVVIRDALDFYLNMAAKEVEEVGPLRGIDAVPITLAPNKVRRPDGVLVSLDVRAPGGPGEDV